ncbi:MAG: hypothetical protein ACTSQJ_18955 [Promethearchaeota archaeon]
MNFLLFPFITFPILISPFFDNWRVGEFNFINMSSSLKKVLKNNTIEIPNNKIEKLKKTIGMKYNSIELRIVSGLTFIKKGTHKKRHNKSIIKKIIINIFILNKKY